MKTRLALSALLSFFCGNVIAAEKIPLSDFIKRPTYSAAKLSPNGEYLAISVDHGDQDVLAVIRLQDMKLIKVNQLPDKKSVGSFYWVSDTRLLFDAVKKMGGYAQPFRLGEWYGVNADGSAPRTIIHRGTQQASQKNKEVGNQIFSLVDTLKDNDEKVVMEARSPRSSEGSGAELVLVDVLNGRRSTLGKAPKSNCSISLGADKQPNFATCYSSRDDSGEYDERTDLYRRNGLKWNLVHTSSNDKRHITIINTSDSGTIYAERSSGTQPSEIGVIESETGQFQPLYSDDVADISGHVWSPLDRSLIAVITEAGKSRIQVLDESSPESQIYVSLAASFPGRLVQFASATKDGNLILFSVSSADKPGELYLYDRKSKQAKFVMRQMEWLRNKQMATVEAFNFTNRDGQTIYGYLTIPAGRKNNLPMIVNPHGGPIGARDDWQFNPETQLLANRGYLVLQVNYRGSSGYGKAFQDAGHRQWGNGIQNDIIDATNWAVSKGYADKNRICIYGGSFGGYASLMAPIRAPGLYKCAFGYVGVYDIEMMFQRGDIAERESGLRYLRKTHGVDKAEWARNSPARHAGDIKIPVFLAAGARDERTPPEQTELMAKALTDAGNPPEGVIIQSGEMHGFYDDQNRLNLYTHMLNFFSKHLNNSAGGP